MAVIRDGDEVMLCSRPAYSSYAGLYEFPGGKCEPGETVHEAAVRELREELGIALEGTLATLYSKVWEDGRFRLHLVVARAFSGTPTPLEGQDIRWVRIPDLPGGLPIIPNDEDFIEVVQKKLS